MLKGLAIIYDPHNLYQFIWYYCTYRNDKKWDALCLPNGFKGQYMDSYCKKSGIFENIFCDDKDFLSVSLAQQFSCFLQMFGYAVIGQQKRFCSKFLGKYINLDDYDEINVMTDVGLVSGLAIGLGAQKRVVIMEDGNGDYIKRSYTNVFKHFFRFPTWKGFLLSIMGYSNTGHVFPLRTTKNCHKYSSHPELMLYNKYASHLKLYDFSHTNRDLFDAAVENVYGNISKFDFSSYDAVFFSEPLDDFFADTNHYHKLIEDYISKCATNILIKKHPRDKWEFSFSDNVKCSVFDQSIPAEVMIPYLKNQRVFFMPYSSIMLYLDSETNEIYSLFLHEALNDSQAVAVLGHYPTKETVLKYLNKNGIKNYSFVEL